MKTVYVYHYCAQSFIGGGDIQYITGIAEYDAPILSYDAYKVLQADIMGTHSLKNVVVSSLTLLGEKEV